MSSTTKIWDDGTWDGPTNMARDVELLRAAECGEVGARVYGWDKAWVSLGRFQTPERALRPDCIVPYVMRPTGGKAVLHGHDVTISLAAPLNTLDVKERSIASVYRAIAEPLVAALNQAGVKAALAEQTAFVQSAGNMADCFAHVSPNDIVDPSSGLKVCGCALRVTATAVLAQCSVPASAPLIDPALVYDHPATYSQRAPQSHSAYVSALLSTLGSLLVRG
ncbi:hypothetical protein QPK87_28290 [Kamptonema cortianum]|nr:hypothetical protein [Geitlerinema splendidum]MDK3160427.1 hypothetical protein [Kamptonema cortianum]